MNDENQDSEDIQDSEDSENDLLRTAYEIFVEIVIIFLIFVVIPYLIGGVWPPFVSITSGSMEPNMNSGDLVFVTDTDRFTTNNSVRGIETDFKYHETDFNKKGDVIIYYPNGDNSSIPIIHRARYYAEEGENWYKYVNKDYVLGGDSCEEIKNCPAPNSGYITKGDANDNYDQSSGLSNPVRHDWIIGKSEFRIPYIGYLSF